MKYTIECDCSVQEAWNLVTDPELLNKWLSIDNEIVLKKRGKFHLVINQDPVHTTEGCKISEYDPPVDKNEGRFVIEWKGPETFDLIMNDFKDVWTHVIFSVSNSHPSIITIEHAGWKSSEDWQKAKNWHNDFWTKKLTLLKNQLNFL